MRFLKILILIQKAFDAKIKAVLSMKKMPVRAKDGLKRTGGRVPVSRIIGVSNNQ